MKHEEPLPAQLSLEELLALLPAGADVEELPGLMPDGLNAVGLFDLLAERNASSSPASHQEEP